MNILSLNHTNAPDELALQHAPSPAAIIYELDAHNNIIAMNQSWQSFALANHAPELDAAQVIGKPLMQFISGNITKQFWQTLLDKARIADAALHLDYRCDSPDVRRFMRMKVYRGERDKLHVESALLRTEARAVPIHFKRAQQRHGDSKIRCSFCNHIRHQSRWVEAESLVAGAHNVTLEVIYGICPLCQSTLDGM